MVNKLERLLLRRVSRRDNGHRRMDLERFCYDGCKGGIIDMVERIRKDSW